MSIADITRQIESEFFVASCRAMALITVESMPMWSAATRIHVDGLLSNAAEEVSSSDDDGNLTAEGVNGSDFGGNFVNRAAVIHRSPCPRPELLLRS